MIPALARSLFALQERVMHRSTLSDLAELERSQWLDREGIEALQTHKLNTLLNLALAHSPWHAARIRAAGIADAVLAHSATLNDLSRLPTMDKRDARDNLEQLVWRNVPGGVFKYTTGGSSGEPLSFYFGRKRQAARHAVNHT